MSGQKIFVLDTNVLVHDPTAIFSFEKSLVAIPIIVLEELDKFKGETSNRGATTRAVIRMLDNLRLQGSLKDGVPLANGGILKVIFLPDQDCSWPFKIDIADNQILKMVYCLKEAGNDVYFISKDLNARVKADVLGIKAEDYLKGNISKENFYKGWRKIKVPAIQLKKEEDLQEIVDYKDLSINEFIILESQHNPYNYRVYRYLGNKYFRTVAPHSLLWPIQARNPQQLMALELLLDPKVQLVSLVGPAGTGKTFLALLAGLNQIIAHDSYRKLLISRPVIPLGPDIGFLPGTISEKLRSWMQPIYDNMDFIAHAANTVNPIITYQEETQEEFYKGRHTGQRKQNRNNKPHKHARNLLSLDELIKENKISLEAITYMRGRSIPFQYILIDEVQNLSPHEVKTLISRVGEGSKIIIAGDPYQIDSPYLDFSSNGLMVATNKFQGQALFGTVFLENSERSELSKLVSELL